MTHYITAHTLSDIPAEVMTRLRLGDPTLICVDPGEHTPLVYLAEALTPFNCDTDDHNEPWVLLPEGKRLPVRDLGVAVTVHCRNLEEGDFFYPLPWADSQHVRCKNPSWKAHTRQHSVPR